MTPPLTTTLDELERLLAESDKETAPNWWTNGLAVFDGHNNPVAEIEDSTADAALIVAAVNALPALIAAAQAALPSKRRVPFRFEPRTIQELPGVAAQPPPPAEADYDLLAAREFVAAFPAAWTGPKVKGRPALDRADLLAAFDEWLGHRREARRYLASTEEGT